MKRRPSIFTPIRSRENLIQEDNYEYKPQRKTKIVCSINEKTCNIDLIRDMIKAGANALSINTAYINDRKQYEKLKNIRDLLESELDHTIPINMMLQGKTLRIGHLKQPEIFLKKDNEIRITHDKKLIGDANIICSEQEELFQQATIGDTIIIDYSQIVLKVIAIENDQEAKNYLMNKYPELYPNEISFMNPIFCDKEDRNKLLSKSSFSSENSFKCNSQSSNSSKKQKYIDQVIENKKQKQTSQQLKVLVCQIETNCLLRPFKPLFIVNNECQQQMMEQKSEDSDEEVETQITPKDINNFTLAKNLDYDSITISNVSSAEEVNELKHLLGQATRIQIFVRITTKEEVDNFDSIMEAADGCIIARAYIASQQDVEDVVSMQSEMILKCRKLVKPVLISTQILESMLTQTNPTFTEMGDIANVVEQHIDGIMLSGETTYGNHPLQVVQALSRICNNIETHSRLTYQGIFHIKIQENPIASIIAQSAIETAFTLRANMILLFTTGETALSLSKLHAPCQIVAVTAKKHIARNLNLVNGVTPYLVGSLYGVDQLLPRILDIVKQRGWVKQGDYIIIISGLFGTQEGIINQMKILQL